MQHTTSAQPLPTKAVLSLEDLNRLVDPFYAALVKLPLKVWTEASRYGCDLRFRGGDGPSNSYYIHAGGARRTITLRVSDHGSYDVVVGMTVQDAKREIASFLNRAKRMKPYDEKAEKQQRKTDWKREAEDALTMGDAIDKTENLIQCRLEDCEVDSDEAKNLRKITQQEIQDMMEVLDENKREAGFPTFNEMLGAYEHVSCLLGQKHLMEQRASYGNDEASASIDQLDWTERYYQKKFPGNARDWQNEYAPDEEIGWLLDEVLGSVEDDDGGANHEVREG
jgi:hypothetical protein